MNDIIRKTTLPVRAFVLAFLFLIVLAVISVSNITYATNNDSLPNGRLITIHDRGIDKVILSQAATVGDALLDAGVIVDSKDAVEPAVTEKLVASDYQINIYRARPVIVVDGNIRTKIITPYQTESQIAQGAGIEIYDEDIATLGRVSDVMTDGAGLQLTIKRAKAFNLTLYGKTSIVRTQAEKISGMLIEKGIKLSENDRISLTMDASIYQNMNVKIWREGKQTITVDEPINFDTDVIENADLSVGYREVKTAGVNGLKSVSYEVIINDDKEVSRSVIASIELKQPVSQIEIVGVKGKYTTPSENENIAWNFFISQGFSRIQTAGIMGNLMQEHRFNTSDVAGGLGIAQWIGSRRSNLISRYPDNYTNIYSQLDYLMYELNGGYSGVKNAILAESSLSGVVEIFQNRFERCNPYYCMLDTRLNYASVILGSHQ